MKKYSTFFFEVTEVSNKMRTAVTLGALVLCCLMQSVNIQAQTTLISATGDGGFENGATFAANGWTLVNGATNQWWVGAVSTPSAGTNAAYVSDDVAGATWNYNVNSASTVHFYRDITFPAGLTNIVLSFKWKGQGEGSYDYVTVYSIPTSTTPTVNIPAGGFQSWLNIPTSYPGATVLCTPPNLNLQATYQTQTACLPSSFAGTTQRIVFMWSNDGSLGTVPPGTVDEISVVASTPPTVPANSPTALVLTPFSNSQINGTFTAAAGLPDAYLVVRYPAGSAVTNPVNGTSYTAGASLGLGKVVSAGASTTFSATGLTPSTAYDFYVYSYTLAPCASGPLYKTTSPLTGTASSLACTGLAAGTYTVGPTGTYASLTAVNAALSNGTTGPVIFELQSTYLSTVETFPVTFNSTPCPIIGGVTIRPQTGATALSITSANATGTISFDGGSNITIDGRAGGVGASQLSISNTSTTGYSIQLINSASFNTIKYCTVAGVNTGTTSGVIVFNTTTGTTGNSNNTIDNCDIRDGATTPLNLIWATGTTTNGYNNLNNNNTISNCTLHDWFNATSTTAGAAINITAGCSDWTITGNSFYQTATRTFSMTTATDQGAIFVASTVFGQNFTITNNFIGGTAPNCGGTPWTWTGGATGTPTPRLIRFSVSNGLPLSNISNNTIANIAITTSSTSTSSSLISHLNGNVNISNNTLGSQTATGNITFTLAATSTAPFFLAISTGTGANPSTINITNNNIGGITVSTNSTGAVSFRVIYGQPVAGSNVTISNNLIGGTVANSIQQLTGGTTAANGSLFGILMLNPTIGNVITNNTLRNLTVNNITVGPSLTGINVQSSGGKHTITGNTVSNLTTNSTNIAINNSASIVGITMTASAIGGTNVSNNTVFNLTNTNTTVAGWISGMYFGTALTPATNTTIAKNFVHSINLASAISGAGMAGIFLPNLGNGLVYNNTVRLGIDASGASITNALQINGMYKASSGSMGIYHNTVYIGGSGVVSGTANTFAFRRTVAPTIGQDTVVNNIFYNARSNASGTGKNYAVNQFANTTLLENYNVLLADGTGGMLGLFNATDCATLAAWQTASNADWNALATDPKLVNPTGSTATLDLHIQAAVVTPVERGGINIPLVATDFDGQTRSGLTPVDIGADAGNFILADLTAPVITYTALLSTNCNTSDQILAGVNITDATGIPTTGTLRPRIYYRKNAGTYFSQPGTLVSGSATNSNWNFTIIAADMGGLIATDVVSYYVIAQDIVATPNVGSNPAGVVATDVNTVTTQPVAPNTYTVNGTSLSGTYTVGVAGTYATLTAAVAAYNAGCIGGPVTFNLIDANYAGETFPITINANAYASATNTLTIKATQANTTISGTSATAMIVLNGADWVTIDGSISNTANTICPASAASRDLTISNNNTSTTSAVIWLQSVAPVNGATNNTIRNINLVGSGNAQTFVGVGSGSSTISTASLGIQNNNNSYINNKISKTQYGIFSQGTSIAIKNTGTVINQNQVNTVAPDNTARGGVLVGFEDNINISGNNISEISFTSSPDVFGIALGGISITNSTFTGNEVTNATISNNIIGSVRNTGTFSACGIFVCPALSGTNRIINNMISGVSANGTGGDISVGILLGGGNNSVTQVYYNTITMTNVAPLTGGSAPSYALAIGGVNPVVDVRNNILTNTQNNGTGNNYAVVYGYTPFTNLTSNNNDYSVGSGATFFIGGTASLSAPTNQLTVANLQAFTGKDGAAQNFAPNFVSATDLHLTATSNQCLDGDGTPIAGLTTDIDCQTRNASTPDIGADEFTNPNLTITVAETSGIANNDGITCAGATVTLTATGGGTYAWSSGANTAVATVNPITTTTYTVTVTNGTCTDVITTTITVNPNPTTNITVTETSGTTNNDGIICAGAAAQLTATGGGTYQWSAGGFTTASIVVLPPVTTTFTVTVTNANGCTATASTTITVNPLPTASISVVENSGLANNDGILCAGASATLTASGGGTYLWSNAANTAAITVSIAGTYTVTVTNANGCTSSTSTVITINPLPTPSITPPSAAICAGQSQTLTASGGTSYVWSNSVATAAITVSPASSTTYTVTVTNANGCSASTSATVTVNPLPVLTETHVDPADCFTANGSIDLTVTGAGSYTYNWSTNNGSGIVNGQQDQSGLSVGTYIVTVTNSGTSCTNTLIVTLSVPGGCGGCPPVASVTVSPNPICAGQTTTMTAVGGINGATYKWFDQLVGGTQVGSGVMLTTGPLSLNTTYYVEQTISTQTSNTFDYTGGVQTFTVPAGVTSISIQALGAQGATGGGTNAGVGAKGGQATGTLAVTPGQVLNIYVGGTGSGVNGGFNGGGNGGNQNGGGGGGATDIRVGGNALANRVIVAGGGGGGGTTGCEVTYMGGNGGDGGGGAGAKGVDSPDGGGGFGGTVGTGGAAGIGCGGFLGAPGNSNGTGGDGQTCCCFSINTVPAGGGGGGGFVTGGGGGGGSAGTVNCNGNNKGGGGGGAGGSSNTGGVTAGTTTNGVRSGNGQIILTYFTPCVSSRVPGTVTVNPLPTPSVSVTETSGTTNNDGIICAGASATLTASGGTNYVWSNGQSTVAITVTPASTTTYTVTVTNANGCTATATSTITVNPLPTPAIAVAETSGTVNNDGTICVGASATLTASGGTSYAWSTGGNTAAITVTPASTTTYTVTVTNANGCSATSTRTITVNPLPTPAIAVAETSGSANNDGQICAGASATLTASGGTSYAWNTGANTAAITVTPASTTTYTVTVTNANGCSATSTSTITVNPLPTPAIAVTETSGTTNNDGIICLGASATLTASGGTGYSWSTGANTAAISVTPGGTTTYTVTVTSAAGCTAVSSTTITVNPLPTPATTVAETSGTTNNDGIICAGASATITATGGTAYLWSTGAATAAITVTPAATTTYTVTVTNANGCSSTTSRTITVNPLPGTFTVTGGGGYCLGTDPGTLVGLSGSVVGVNYQLQRGGVNVGAPVAGTGNVLSFGLQTVVGTYTVIGTSVSTNCSINMTGSVTIFTFNCNAAITDPCVCKNNATTLINGQFDETIQVNAPSNQTWVVLSVNGLYSSASPLPPAAPSPILVGTVLTPLGGNAFQLKGIHVDALGYTLVVTNNQGTTLSIGNSCQYPNPAITSVLDGPFCLYSDIVPLTGTPGDANIVSAVFTVNGVVATQFDPGAGVGQYVIEYTVNGGTPKAFGANDPGCIQKVSNTVNVIATPSQLACNDLVYLSLDVDCISEINPDDILEGSYGCYDDYIVELDETLPYGNGPWVPAVVGAGDVGKTYQVRVTHLVTGNKCWGNIKIEDKLEPVIVCSNITLFCPITNYEPNYLKNTLGIAAAFPTVTDCSNYTLTYIDTYKDLACGQGFNGVNDLSAYVIRKWTAKDAWGNESICTQYIYFKRLHVQDVLFPADFTISCNSNNINTNPSVTGVPYVKAFGINWGLFPDPAFCEMQAAYADQILPVCDGTYKILRTWTVIDWCLPTTPFPPSANPQYYIQLIKVVDDKGPALVCPVDITVTTDPYTCCATSNLPDVILKDNCSRINNIGGMVTTFDPYTGQQLAMYTIGGSLTSFPGNNLWDLDTLGNWGNTPCLPIGTHRVVYTAEDDCGNTSTCSFRLTVADYVPPVAACDQYTVASVIGDDPFDCYEPADGCDGAGVTWIKATTFDDGSYDNCNNLKFTVRRMAPYSDCINNLQDCEKPRATEEQDSIKFYCCEVGTTQTVILRVYQVDLNGQIMNGPDGTPLYNECMVNVEVQDKIKPVCVPPANVTVSCENFDPSLWAYGKPAVYDNCCLDKSKVYQGQCGLTHTVNLSLFDTVCNKGTITRTFRAFDCHGLSSQCTQRVVVNYEQDYFVKFPNDVIVSVCDGTGNYGAPTFFGEDCELLGVSFEDEVFTVVPDACFKIERTWTVINWCTYNPNLGCINVPNPNPNAITNHPSNLPGVTVSPLGTATPWNPTVVKINPTDATTTNYSIFYDPNANCYKYKQIIKVIDTQDPTVTAPTSPVEYCDVTPNDAQLWNGSYWWDNTISSHDLCEGDADLSITGTDACSGSNISFRYLLFLDLDGDNVMETVVSSTNLPGVNNVQFGNAGNVNYTGGQPRAFDGRPVPFNQQYRFGLDWTTSGTSATAKVRFDNLQSPIALPGTGNNVMQGVVPQLPYGTHKIKWFVEDGCGNETISEYTFVVKDCKKPTVVCLNGLSVNIMPTQMIQLWASDFLQYTQDNCTPADQLKIAIRKSSDPTPGFPVDAQGNPITSVTFTCGELGTQLVKLWSIDKAGNADYCETYVIVQDNNANCPPSSGAAKVAGALATEATNGVQDGNVEIAGSGNGIPSFTFTTMSNASGAYNFNAIPLATNSTVTPAKDDNPLNGVSTYDLVLISKHILGIESLNSPYKMIAADANKSGSITTFDIVELRKLILGIYSELPNNTSWRFVDKSYVFPNVNNPFQATFAENKSILNLSTNMLNEDFVSVKVGDVNGNAIANAAMSSDDRSSGTLLFDVDNKSVKAGETFTVSFKAAEVVAGYQFTMNFRGLEVVDVTPGTNMKSENFGVFASAITTSFDGANQGEFTVTFRAAKGGNLSELLSVSSQITKAEAYKNGERMDVAFRFNNNGASTIAGVGFELYQNQPNPFVNKTMIGFHLPEATTATLSIFDETGRLVYNQKGSFAKGYNSIAIDRALLNTVGVMYYKLETATDSATKKMIQTK